MNENEPRQASEPENEESGEYEMLTPEEAETAAVFCAEQVKDWHDRVKPDVIFLTDAAAVPMGYAFKEAWKHSYPDEDKPKFIRIDPRLLFSLFNEENEQREAHTREEAKGLMDLDAGKQWGATEQQVDRLFDNIEYQLASGSRSALVYDEISRPVIGEDEFRSRAVQLKAGGSTTGTKLSGNSVRIVVDTLDEAGFADVWVFMGIPHMPKSLVTRDKNKGPWKRDEGRQGEYRKRAIAYIRDLKKIGRSAANKINEAS